MGSSGHRNSLQEKIGSNFYEKICLRGVSNLSAMCGDRLWAFERVLGAFLEGFDDKEERNVQTKMECEKMCLFETSFTCR
jgi:PAN domain